MRSNPNVPAVALVALLALVISGAAVSVARAAAAGEQTFKDWIARCEPANEEHGRRCVLYQKLTDGKGDKERQLLTTVVGRFGEEIGLAALFTVPLGVFLPAGMVLQVDGGSEKKRLDYQFCTPNGCRATMKLDDRWLKLFKAGSKAMVTIEDARHQDFPLPISLHGFTDGLGHLSAE